MSDLVDYLRDKLEHADDGPTITIMRPSGYFWMDTKGNLTPFDERAPRTKKRWWRR